MSGIHAARSVIPTSTSRGWRRFAAITAASVAVALGASVGAAPPVAADPLASEATSQFLTGSVGALDLATLTGPATASFPGTPSPAPVPIDAGTINALSTTLTGGLPLFGPSGVLDLGSGSLNQVASAASATDGLAAVGAVSDAGVPDVATLGTPTTIDASGLLASVPAVSSALSQLAVTLDGIAATATRAGGGVPIGQSDISGGVLTTASPILSGIPSSVLTALTPVQSALTGLGGSSGGLATAVNGIGVVQQVLTTLGAPATNTVTVGSASLLSSAVAPLLSHTLTSPDGLVGVDLSTGTVTADLAGLLGGNLGSLPAGTDVLSPAILSTIAKKVTALVQGLVSTIKSTVSSAIKSAPVSLTSTAGSLLGLTGMNITATGTIDQILAGTATTTRVLKLLGAPLTLSQADLLSALSLPIDTSVLNGAMPTFVTALTDQVSTPTTGTLAPALGAVDSVMSMTSNVQSLTGGTFNVTALLTSLLPGTNPLALLGLGAASIGTIPTVAPTATSLSPVRGPVAGGQRVTVNGSTFVPNLTKVHVGATTIPASAVSVATDGTSLTFRTPRHAAGSVAVTVETPLGTSGALSYRYLPVPKASALHPNSGPASGGRPLTITGSGFVRGATSVKIGATKIGTGKVKVASATRLSVTTPAHGAGSVSVSVATPGGRSAARTYTYRRAPGLTGISTGRTSRAGGRTVTLTGSRFVPGHTGVRVGSLRLRASEVSVVSASKLRFTTPAHAKGLVGVSVFTVGGASANRSLRYVAGTRRALRISGFRAHSTATTTGGQRLTITGSGFVPGSTSVRFGTSGVGAAVVTVVSPSRLWVLTPAHSAGRVSIRVAVAGRTSNALAYVYVRPSATPTGGMRVTAPRSGSATSNEAPFASGTGRAGAAVSVFVDGVGYCSTRVRSSGAWSCYTTVALLPGSHTVRARQSASGHSASRLTAAVSFTIR